jgi:hypothetical protein
MPDFIVACHVLAVRLVAAARIDDPSGNASRGVDSQVSPFGFTISYHIHSSVNVVEMDAIWAVTG